MSYYTTTTVAVTQTGTLALPTTSTVSSLIVVTANGGLSPFRCTTTSAPVCAPCYVDAASDVYSYPSGSLRLLNSTLDIQPYIYTANGSLTTSYSTITTSNTAPNGTKSSNVTASQTSLYDTFSGAITWVTNNLTLTYPTTYIQYHDFIGAGPSTTPGSTANPTAATCAQLASASEFSLPSTAVAQSFLYALNGTNIPSLPAAIPAQILTYLDSFPAVVSQLGNQPIMSCLPTSCIAQPSTSPSSSVITPSVCSTCALLTLPPGLTVATTVISTTYPSTVFTYTSYTSNQPFFSYSTKNASSTANTYTAKVSAAPYKNSTASATVSVCFTTCTYTTTMTVVTTVTSASLSTVSLITTLVSSVTPSSAYTVVTNILTPIPGNPLGDDETSTPGDSLPSSKAQVTTAGTNPAAAPPSASPESEPPGSPPDTAPANTAPAGSTPASTAPVSTAPASTVPASTVPASTVPASTVPASTVPASTVPASTVPGSTIPGSTVSGSTIPGSTVPGSTVPGSTVPASTIPASTVPGSTVPGSTVPGSTVPGSTVPGSTVPGSTVPGSTASSPASQSSCTDAICGLTQEPAPTAIGASSPSNEQATASQASGSVSATSVAVIPGLSSSLTASLVGSNSVAIGSTTISVGQAITLPNNEVVSAGSSGIQYGGSTIPFSTLAPGATAIPLTGLASAASTIALTTLAPGVSTSTISAGAVFTGLGTTITASRVGSGTFALGSTTITQGQSATLPNGQVVSVNTAGSLAGASTSTLSGAVFSGAGTTVIASQIGSGTFAIGSATLTAGQSTTLPNGQVISVNSAGSLVQGGGTKTSAISYYTIDGQTLTPGGVITEQGTTVSLAPNGGTYFVNGTPVPVASGGVISLGTSRITAAITSKTTTDMGSYIISGIGGQGSGTSPTASRTGTTSQAGVASRYHVAGVAVPAVIMAGALAL